MSTSGEDRKQPGDLSEYLSQDTKSSSSQDIVEHKHAGNAIHPFNVEVEAVSWERDLQNPRNWSSTRKWTVVAVVGWLQSISPLASVMLAPSLPKIATDLQITSSPLLAFTLSVYLLGSAVSALVAAPLSEVFGRRPIYLGSSGLFFAFTLACGFSKSALTLLILRLFAGALGSACLSVGAGTNADIFERHQRGKAMSITAGVLLAAPSVGPALGGVVTHALGWRWVFYILGCVGGLNVVLVFFLLKETHGEVVLRRRKTKHIAGIEEVPNPSIPNAGSDIGQGWRVVRNAILVPLKLLFRSPVVSLCCLSSACVFGVVYMIITTIPFIFGPQYGFSEQQSGLVYLALGGGLLAGLTVVGRLSDRMAVKHSAGTQEGPYKPEVRLSLAFICPGTLLTAAGLLIYGWTAEYNVHWAVVIAGLFLFGSGILLMTSPTLVYLVDCYPSHAASVIAANALLRSIATGLLPLGGLDMYDVLGFGWGATVLIAVIVTACTINLLCRAKGLEMRSRFPLKV